MKFAKFDPITGQLVASGECPDGEPQEEVDQHGLLVFHFEGSLAEYQFDHTTMSLVARPVDPVIELRRLLAAEKRPPTPEELAQLTDPAPVKTPKERV